MTSRADNAVKRSPPGQTVEVEVAHTDAAVWVRVLDRGPGSSTKDRAQRFSEGARLNARPTGGEPSHGLGLFGVHRLGTGVGGTVDATTRPGGGACFTVRWPVA